MSGLIHFMLWWSMVFGQFTVPQHTGATSGAPSAPTPTEICSVNGTSCTPGNNAASGSGVIVFITSENSSPSYTITDPCTDTYTQSTASPIYSSVAGTTVSAYISKLTCSITSGTGSWSVSGSTISILAVYTENPYPSSSQSGVYASATQNASSYTTPASSGSVTAQTICWAGMMSAGSGNTFTAGTGFTLLAGSNTVVDTRPSAFEYKVVSSGTVTFTATPAGTTAGSILGQCQ